MDELTLDTNLLRDWAWCEGRGNEKRYSGDQPKKAQLRVCFAELRRLRDQGRCELGITTQLFTDYDGKTLSELPPHIRDMVGPYVNIAPPSIFMCPLAFPTVFASASTTEELLRDVFPNTKPEHRKYLDNRKDALQLHAHLLAKRDVFLTNDNSILRSQDLLKRKWEILTMDPCSYVDSGED